MSVLSKDEIENWDVRKIKHQGYIFIHINNLIDTIADRDKQIEELERKVKELEEQVHGPFPDHRSDCDKLIQDPKCTCGAVKEPEVIFKENKEIPYIDKTK